MTAVPPHYALFYHIWTPSGSPIWRILVDEQLKRIARNGIHNFCDVHILVSGSEKEAACSYLTHFPWISSVRQAERDDEYEMPTLNWLAATCRRNLALVSVCYIHTKGISQLTNSLNDQDFLAANSWRHFMEWGALDNWRRSVILTQHFDVVGVNYKTHPWPHISGNMWWANATYVRRLCKPSETYADDQWPVFGNHKSRYLGEKWIGSGDPRVFSYYGLPYRQDGRTLTDDNQHGFNLYIQDIEPFYRTNAF